MKRHIVCLSRECAGTLPKPADLLWIWTSPFHFLYWLLGCDAPPGYTKGYIL